MSKRAKRLARAGVTAICIAAIGHASVSVYAEPSSAELQRKTSNLQSELNGLNGQLNDLIVQMDAMSQEAEELAGAMTETQTRLDAAQAAGEEQYEAMKLRIKYIYEAGDTSFIELLCSAESMTDFLNKTDFVTTVNEYDRNMLNELLNTQEQIAEEGRKLETQHQELVAKQEELANKRTEVESMISSTSGELSNYTAQLERARQAELLASRQAAEQAAQQAAGSGGQTSNQQTSGSGGQTSGTTTSRPTPPPVYNPGDSTGKQSLGSFRITHYCNCYLCCGSWAGGPTATGTIPTQGRTIAVDPSVIPLGSRVIINGQVYTAEDTGGAIQGNKIDIYVSNHALTTQYGVYYADVYMAD
jgi:peptidoglycan hydrolase CwlO-like protein/3D (Asp-Asp-Asp) domain-containing protein